MRDPAFAAAATSAPIMEGEEKAREVMREASKGGEKMREVMRGAGSESPARVETATTIAEYCSHVDQVKLARKN